MKKTILTISLSIFYALATNAQATIDSLNFSKANWEVKDLGKGITWQHFHFKNKDIFNSNQNINILKLKNKNRKVKKALVSAGDSLIVTSVLAQQNKALAAINGSFFDTKNGGAVDFIKVDGKVLDSTVLTKGKRTFHQKSAVIIHKNRLEILNEDSLNVKWDESLDYQNVMVTGPLLMWKGNDYPLSNIAFNDNRHPRTCACITKKNELILMTIDGRTAESQGVSLPELTTLSRWLGCRDAVNFDGGGSTTMYIEGQGVVNMPCDNKKFDHEGERKVSNLFVLKLNY